MRSEGCFRRSQRLFRESQGVPKSPIGVTEGFRGVLRGPMILQGVPGGLRGRTRGFQRRFLGVWSVLGSQAVLGGLKGTFRRSLGCFIILKRS